MQWLQCSGCSAVTRNIQERPEEPGAGQGTSRKCQRNQRMDRERAGKAEETGGWPRNEQERPEEPEDGQGTSRKVRRNQGMDK